MVLLLRGITRSARWGPIRTWRPYVIGAGNQAMGGASIGIGANNHAKQDYACAIGLDCSALGIASFAMGRSNVAHGNASRALGNHCTAGSSASVGVCAFADGSGCNAVGDYHVAFGHEAATDSSNVFVYSLGDSSWAFGFDADNSGCLKYNGHGNSFGKLSRFEVAAGG